MDTLESLEEAACNLVDGVGLTDSQVEEGLHSVGLSSQTSFNDIWSTEEHGFTKLLDFHNGIDYEDIEDGGDRFELQSDKYMIHANNSELTLNQLGITGWGNPGQSAVSDESQAMSSSMQMHNYAEYDPRAQSMHGENLAMPDTTQTCNIPSNTNYPGEYNFSLSFLEQSEKMTKSTSWTYSEQLDKLFINMGVSCIVCFRVLKRPPPGCIIRALPIFEKSDHIKDVVKRCPTHCLPTDQSNHGHVAPEHLVRCDSDIAEYCLDPNSGRQSVVVPFVPPQAGTDSSQYLYKFMCLGSCVGGLNRRPLKLIYTLEKDGQVLGRRALKVRICACPGRDRKAEECPPCNAGVPNKKSRNLAQTTSTDILVIEPASKKQKFDDELFTLTIQGRANYEVLLKVKEALELASLVPKETMQAYRVDQQQIVPSQSNAAKPPDLPSTSKNSEIVKSTLATQTSFSANSKMEMKRAYSIGCETSGASLERQTSISSNQAKIKREPNELVSSWLSSINMGCYADVFAKKGYTYMRDLEDLIEDDIYRLPIGRAHRLPIWKNLLDYKGLPSSSPPSQASLPPLLSFSQNSTGQDSIIHISHVRFKRVASIKKTIPE